MLPPVTTPEDDTLAIAVELLLHVPPPDASLKGVVSPEQTLIVPVMGAGGAATETVVIDEVVLQPPPLTFVTITV